MTLLHADALQDACCFCTRRKLQVRVSTGTGVVSALSDQGIRGMTVADVAGIGFQGGVASAAMFRLCRFGGA